MFYIRLKIAAMRGRMKKLRVAALLQLSESHCAQNPESTVPSAHGPHPAVGELYKSGFVAASPGLGKVIIKSRGL